MRRLPAVVIFVCVFPLSVWIHAQPLRGTQPAPATPAARAQENQQPGEVRFDADNQEERDSGVWIDGKYFGYVKELKGNKKVLLAPGEHEISVRQDGYKNFEQKITVQAGQAAVRQCGDGGESQSHLSRRRRGRTAPGYSAQARRCFRGRCLRGARRRLRREVSLHVGEPGKTSAQSHSRWLSGVPKGDQPGCQRKIAHEDCPRQRRRIRSITSFPRRQRRAIGATFCLD